MPINLILFDLDGTLLNTADDIAGSMNRVLAAHQYPGHETGWYKEKVGSGARRLLTDALPPGHRLDGVRFDALLGAYQREYQAHCMEATCPYPGIPELLQSLTARKMKIAVVTNKPQASAEITLRRYFPETHFFAVCGDRPGQPLKPDPSAAYEILAAAGVPPGGAAVIGDGEADMAFAVRAGVFGVGVLWGFRGRETLIRHGARVLAETPGDIIKILNI